MISENIVDFNENAHLKKMPHRSLQRVKKKKKFIRFKRYGVNDRSTKIAITNTTKRKKTGLNTTSTHTQNNTFNNNFFYDKTW